MPKRDPKSHNKVHCEKSHSGSKIPFSQAAANNYDDGDARCSSCYLRGACRLLAVEKALKKEAANLVKKEQKLRKEPSQVLLQQPGKQNSKAL